MELKNCRIGVLLEDYLLRRRITDLLLQNGAIVRCARDETEMTGLSPNYQLKMMKGRMYSSYASGFLDQNSKRLPSRS